LSNWHPVTLTPNICQALLCVTFGDVTLLPGEFLVGGYSNFLFSFKEVTAAPMENAITLLAPFCDPAAAEKDASQLALLAPTFMMGW